MQWPGVGEEREDRDAFQAALGMAFFDPVAGRRHPLLRGAAADEVDRNFPVASTTGKALLR